jgi:hypothetical protein
LQRIAVEGLDNWNAQRIEQAGQAFGAELQRLGVAAGEIHDAARRVGDALLKTIADARGRWSMDAHRSAHSEWRVSGILNDVVMNVAIDRTFFDESGARWIIDFKTGSHEGGDPAAFLDNEQRRYRLQLETYAALVCALPGAAGSLPIRLGLYFPMLSGWREWEWWPGTPAQPDA